MAPFPAEKVGPAGPPLACAYDENDRLAIIGGMGLVANAIEQGRQAMDGVARAKGRPAQVDVLVVGAFSDEIALLPAESPM